MKKRVIFAISALLIVLAFLCSCSAGGREAMNDSGKYYDPIDYEDGYKYDYTAEPKESGAPVSDKTDVSVDGQSQKLIKTVSMSVETLEFDAFVEKLNAALAAAEGYTEDSNIAKYSYSSLRTGSFTLRVPAKNLDAFTSAVKGEGTLLSYSENAVDVSLTYADLEGRLTALRAEQTALNNMLEKADNVSDCITIESRLSEVRGQIESIEGQLRVLSSKISYSTVKVTVQEVEKVTVDEKEQTVWEQLADKFKENAESAGEYLRDLFVGFVAGLPTFGAVIVTILLVLTPPSLVALIIVLCVRKKRKKNAAKKAAMTVEEKKA